jgi:hypothetical protein
LVFILKRYRVRSALNFFLDSAIATVMTREFESFLAYTGSADILQIKFFTIDFVEFIMIVMVSLYRKIQRLKSNSLKR